ncbi:uncharacterized protein [Arachis hypogaea]|uniref:uncharacterized protein n=1 Tax=Arachis hypogaea TaxID=3818 RepID=UPI000DEC2774|nr:uncharacterized protein LOC112803320 [Arachis hypogaea]
MANELAQIASGTLESLIGIHQILVPAIEREVLCDDEWEDTDWRKPIVQYLKEPNIPANGQVEAANKILISLIKKHIGNRPRTWNETLSQVLWAYRNSPRSSTVSRQHDLPVDDYWNAMFDELNELDSERISALDNMIRQKESIARSYNRRIKEKFFNVGELVLKVILPMEKKSRFLGSSLNEGLDIAGLEIAGTSTGTLFSWITLFKTEIKSSKVALVGVVGALDDPGLGPGGV